MVLEGVYVLNQMKISDHCKSKLIPPPRRKPKQYTLITCNLLKFKKIKKNCNLEFFKYYHLIVDF